MVMVVNSAAAAKAMAASGGASRSGLQKQVLALYKRALRAAQQKDRELAVAQREASSATAAAPEATADVSVSDNSTYAYVRERFRDDATSVRRVDFNVIEHLLRKGERDLKMLARMKGAHFARVPRNNAS